MKTGCAKPMEKIGFVDVLTKLLTTTHSALVACNWAGSTTSPHHHTKTDKENKEKEKPEGLLTPKWLAPTLLLLDLYEKLSIATKRRASVLKISNHAWKWFEMSTAKWCTYTPNNNNTIDDAYWRGETSVRITNGRRKYTIQFNTMVQVSLFF